MQVVLDALASVFQLFDANGNQEQQFYNLFEDVCISQLLNSWVFRHFTSPLHMREMLY
jgi:hypothetical protein